MNLLTIVLLTRNRPVYAVGAIESILNQSEKNFKFVVSDNSTNKELQEIMNSRFPEVEYNSWFPGVSLMEHFKKVISQIDTQYYVMFHDDDLMEPDYVSRVLEEFKKMPSAAAIGTNAWLIDENGENIDNQMTYVGPEQIRVITSEKILLRQYLSNDFGGVVAFCSYAYNSELIKGILPDTSKWHYFDTYFLMEIAGRGPLLWINEPLINARRHKNTVSSDSGVRDYKPILNVGRDLLGPIIKQRHLDEYRFLRLLFALKARGKLPIPALKYFFIIFLKLVFLSYSFRKRILRKILA
jgi:glycosyltransferase involved in cell wall biosynthesis